MTRIISASTLYTSMPVCNNSSLTSSDTDSATEPEGPKVAVVTIGHPVAGERYPVQSTKPHLQGRSRLATKLP